MADPNYDSGFKRLDQLARREYGRSFRKIAAAAGSNEMDLRRVARLTGIEIKYSFSTPTYHLIKRSATGARRSWPFNEKLLAPGAIAERAWDKLQADQSFQIAKSVLEESHRREGFPERELRPEDLRLNENETSWFGALLLAVRPRLCGNKQTSGTPTLTEEQGEFWELAKLASEKIAENVAEATIAPVVDKLCTLVPFLADRSHTVAVGLAIVLVHYAKKNYCKEEIRTGMFTLLGLADTTERVGMAVGVN